MNLLKSPNRWSCGITSLAMLLGRRVEQLIADIGHDGSEIWRPEFEEPLCRRGFHEQEFVDVCYKYGLALIWIEARPESYVRDMSTAIQIPLPEDRIEKYMDANCGLIIGQYNPRTSHMCAWDGRYVYDPTGPRRYSFDEVGISKITVSSFGLLM